MNEKKYVRSKLISIIVLFILNVATITVLVIGLRQNYYYYFISLIFVEIIFLVLFICSFFLISIKKYNIDGTEILCYAGWSKHLLIVNGELVDEHNTMFFFTPLELTYKDDNHEYYMRVSLSNSISLKVDGKLAKKL